MGSQTNGKNPPLRYATIGLETFDHPTFAKLSLADIGLWVFLLAEACKTHGVLSMATVKKAYGFGLRRQAQRSFAILLAEGLVTDRADGWYYFNGWEKHQLDPKHFERSPSDLPDATRERKRKSRERQRAASLREGVTSMSRRDVTTRLDDAFGVESAPARIREAAGGATMTATQPQSVADILDSRSFSEKMGATKEQLLGPAPPKRLDRRSTS